MKNFKIINNIFLVSASVFLPVVSFAQTATAAGCSLLPNTTFGNLLDFITCNISRSVVPLIFSLAVATFVWGVVQYVILGAEEEAKRAKGRQFMIWGILALAVMVSVWGLVKIVTTTFNINPGKSIIPQLQEK